MKDGLRLATALRHAAKLLLVPLVWLVACGPGADADRPEQPPAQPDATTDATTDAGAPSASAGVAASQGPGAAGYEVIDVGGGGTVQGTVRFSGEVPAPSTVEVSTDTETCGSTRQVETLVVGPAGGLADVVVSLVDVRRGAPFTPQSAPSLDQRDCTFRPHIMIVPTDTTVHVLNSDPLTHNVHTAAFDNRTVNLMQQADQDAVALRFDVPEKVRVRCDLHPWMSAWIVAADHPYHTVTDESGSFALLPVPPGTYTVEFWHETLGAQTREVTVASGAATTLDVDLANGG